MKINIKLILIFFLLIFRLTTVQGHIFISESSKQNTFFKNEVWENGSTQFAQISGERTILAAEEKLSFRKEECVIASEENKNIRIASLSYIPVKWDKQANLVTIEKMAKEAAAAGAQLVITPEGGLEGYLINVLRESKEREKWESRFQEIAEPVDGPCVMQIKSLARELGIDIVLGFLERDGDILYNSCAWIDPKGEMLHVHRKTHMYQPYFDPENYQPGFELKAFDTRHGRIGMMICFERQVPEVARALALDGARIIINPSYGSRGEWNTTMLRTRARDNGVGLIFTHPKQTLAIGANGRVLMDEDNEDGPGIVFVDLEVSDKKYKSLTKRRPEVFAEKLEENIAGGNQRMSRPRHIKVAAVQMRSTHNLNENVEKICGYLAECAKEGVRVAAFPECATTGYFTNEILNYSEQDYLDAEKTIAAACKENKIYAVVGTPYFENGKRYNMALVVNPEGKTVFRQPKIHLVGGDKGWAQPGKRLGIFGVDGDTCSIVICHDSRYPELTRLPVLKGSRLVFYISWESDIGAEAKIEPYHAQVVARAVENNIYIVHANAPQTLSPFEGSHGQSRIVGPDGTLIQESPIFEEDILIQVLDLSRASRSSALKSSKNNFLESWWKNGMEYISEF